MTLASLGERSGPVSNAPDPRLLSTCLDPASPWYGVLDAAGVGIALLNPQGDYLRANPIFAACSGRRPDDLVGLNHLALHAGARGLAEIFRKVAEGGRRRAYRASAEGEGPEPLTGLGAWDWTLARIDLDGRHHLVMTVIDARPRVLAEQALSFARNGFLGLLSDMSSAMYHLGPLGETTECLGMDALAGDPQASGYPDRGAWCRLIHEEDRARVADAVLAARTNGALSALHYRIRRPDGAVRQVAEYMRAVATRRGPGTVGLILDVTDRLPSACRPKPRPAGPHRAALELAARQALARVVCDEAEVAFGGDCVAVTAHGSCRHDARASSMPTAMLARAVRDGRAMSGRDESGAYRLLVANSAEGRRHGAICVGRAARPFTAEEAEALHGLLRATVALDPRLDSVAGEGEAPSPEGDVFNWRFDIDAGLLHCPVGLRRELHLRGRGPLRLQRIAARVLPEDRRRIALEWGRVLDGAASAGPAVLTLRMRIPPATVTWVEVAMHFVVDASGRPIAAMGSARILRRTRGVAEEGHPTPAAR